MYVPNELDGARVILYTNNKVSNNFGNVRYEDHDEKITALAIAKYEKDNNYYLFGCNMEWEVIADTLHSTIDEAKSCVENSIKADKITWNVV